MFDIGVVGGRKEHGAILEDRPVRELLQNSMWNADAAGLMGRGG